MCLIFCFYLIGNLTVKGCVNPFFKLSRWQTESNQNRKKSVIRSGWRIWSEYLIYKKEIWKKDRLVTYVQALTSIWDSDLPNYSEDCGRTWKRERQINFMETWKLRKAIFWTRVQKLPLTSIQFSTEIKVRKYFFLTFPADF